MIRWAAFCAIPVRAHVTIGFLTSWLRARLKSPPSHVRENVRYVFEDLDATEIERIVARHWEYILRLYLMRVLPRHPRFHDPEAWPVEGAEHLDAALEGNRGAVLAISHYGYQKLIKCVLHAHGYDVMQVASPRIFRRHGERSERLARESLLRRYVYERTFLDEHELGENLIGVQLDVRPIVEALGRNQAVAIAADGRFALRAMNLELLGKPFPFPVGFMKLAMHLGAPVLPAFATERGRRIRVEIHPPLDIDPDGDIARNVESFVRVFEDRISASPHQWRAFITEDYFVKAAG